MSTEDNKNIVRRYREIYNSNNLDALGEVLAPAFVAHNMLPNVPQTLEGARMIHSQSVAVFPDSHVTTNDLIAENNLVVERWTLTMHHSGAPFFIGNVPASGKKVEVSGISTYRLAGGKIVETWADMDFLGVMQQVGLIPAQS